MLIVRSGYGQIEGGQVLDSLWQKDYEELISLYKEYNDSKEKALLYASAFYKKTMLEANDQMKPRAFHFMARESSDEEAIKYYDSLIESVGKYYEPNNYYPAAAYINKGKIFYKKRNFKESIDNYIIGYNTAKKFNNPNLIFIAKSNIGILKNRAGDFDQALDIHLENFNYVEANDERVGTNNYLAALYSVADAYRNLNLLDSASFWNRKGIEESIIRNNERRKNHFILNEAVVLHLQGEYLKSIDSIEKVLPFIYNVGDKPNEAVAHFYLGKNYLNTDKEALGIEYLKKVDLVFQETKDILPELSEAYDILTDHYREKGDVENQLIYIEKLIEVDSAITVNNAYLNKQITAKYDIPELINEKEKLIQSLKNDQNYLALVFLLSVLLLVIIIAYLYKRQIVYKKRFNAIISEDSENKRKTESTEELKTDSGIPEEILNKLLEKLSKFENTDKYVNKDVSLQTLSKDFETNPKYLSMTINYAKKKNFPAYINDLRIDYAMKRLKNDPSFRKYTVKAIATDCGFKSAETFSKFFYKKNGIYPSYFIKQLDKMGV
ncbi:helix-turn-helix domain-containing protein [Sungkyunkwania multivorans]|uniref:Helix-turn-helix domain-containing protein n=1 Tax=Sungkyunkwania multivorans TaxID=1173618 RepID=A0ABW3D478_9FLAO